MSGAAKKSMMELMGHRDGSMTDRYTHLSVEYHRAAVGKLPTFTEASKTPVNSPAAEGGTLVRFAK
jgi:hypothetical protein